MNAQSDLTSAVHVDGSRADEPRVSTIRSAMRGCRIVVPPKLPFLAIIATADCDRHRVDSSTIRAKARRCAATLASVDISEFRCKAGSQILYPLISIDLAPIDCRVGRYRFTPLKKGDHHGKNRKGSV